MILMWLGSLVIMIYGFVLTQKSASDIFLNWQKGLFDKGGETSTAKMFSQGSALVLLEGSAQKSLYTALAFYNLRILSLRMAVLWMCLSPLGVWLILALALLSLNFNGFFILGVCAVAWLSHSLSGRFEKTVNVLLGVGLFLVGSEATLRNSRVVQSLLGQSDLAFMLADGRFLAVLTVILASFLLGLFMRFEVWALILSLALITTSTLSFNGALGVVLGAKLAEAALFYARTRPLNQDCQRLGRQFAMASSAGLIVGFIFVGEMRTALNWGFTTEFSAIQEKSLQFILCFAILHLAQWMALMVWGHWAGRRPLDEIQDAKYFSPSWIREDLVSVSGRQWAKEKVHKRLSEIRYHLAGLSSLKEGQVPEPMQARLKEEEKQLSQLTFL